MILSSRAGRPPTVIVSLNSLLSHIRSLVMARKYSPASGKMSVTQRSNIRKPFDELIVPDVFSQLHLADGAQGRPQHLKGLQYEFRRHAVDAVDQAIDVEVATVREIGKQLHLAEIDRRREAD